MLRQTILRLSADDERVSWWHPEAGEGAGSLEQFPDPGATPLIVLAPAEETLIVEVALPGRNRARLIQALPFALEDQLADDLDRYHFALGEALGGGRYLAAAVNRGLMDGWLERLHGRGLEPLTLLPEALALPAPRDESTGTLAIDGERALVRIGASRAYAVGRDELAAFLELEPDLRTLTLHGAGALELPGTEVLRAPGGSLLALLAEGARFGHLNLLQEAYQPASERSARARRVWKLAAAVGMLVVLLAAAQQGLEYRQLASRVDALQARAETLFTQAFPETARVVNPRAQMEQGLDALRTARGDLGQAGFLYLLRMAGPSLAESVGVSLKALSYRADGLVLDIHATDLARIEDLRQKIRDRSGVAVVLESAATLADGADGRLRLQGAPG